MNGKRWFGQKLSASFARPSAGRVASLKRKAPASPPSDDFGEGPSWSKTPTDFLQKDQAPLPVIHEEHSEPAVMASNSTSADTPLGLPLSSPAMHSPLPFPPPSSEDLVIEFLGDWDSYIYSLGPPSHPSFLPSRTASLILDIIGRARSEDGLLLRSVPNSCIDLELDPPALLEPPAPSLQGHLVTSNPAQETPRVSPRLPVVNPRLSMQPTLLLEWKAPSSPRSFPEGSDDGNCDVVEYTSFIEGDLFPSPLESADLSLSPDYRPRRKGRGRNKVFSKSRSSRRLRDLSPELCTGITQVRPRHNNKIMGCLDDALGTIEIAKFLNVPIEGEEQSMIEKLVAMEELEEEATRL